jgi:hypothetical protein
MLFPYIPFRHGMREMHAFVAYIFAKVWCKAPNHDYSIDLFRGFPSLYTIMEQLDLEDKAGNDKGAGAFFFRHVNEIFIEFKSLTSDEIKNCRKMFLANNNIRALCEGRHIPSRYPSGTMTPLMQKLKFFFSGLYSSGFFNLAIVKSNLGTNLHEHYREFARVNEIPCCPFCGLQPMDTEYDPTREAYDHYLPASVYPFNSVNFKNLAPACHKCNSQIKGAKDPLLSKTGTQRRAFYPYSPNNYNIKISVSFANTGNLPTKPEHIKINLACPGHTSEISTWNSLYKIKSRYAAKCCAPQISKAWLNRILIECRNYGRSPQQALEAELLTCHESPWVEISFLKAAFLQEAYRTGLIQSLITPP